MIVVPELFVSLMVCVEDTMGMKNELKPGSTAPEATVTVWVDAVIIMSVEASPVEPAVGIHILRASKIFVLLWPSQVAEFPLAMVDETKVNVTPTALVALKYGIPNHPYAMALPSCP